MATATGALAFLEELDALEFSIKLRGKEVPFTPLNLTDITRIAGRFPGMREMFTGEKDVDTSDFSKADSTRLELMVISTALHPELEEGSAEHDRLCEMLKTKVTPFERELAVVKIMNSVSTADLADGDSGKPGNAKPAGKKAPARTATSKRTNRRKAPAKSR